jgi:TatD DNase family protein
VYPSKKKEKFEQGQMVKGRNEPCHMIQVLEVLAGIQELPLETVEAAVFENTIRLFPSLA